MTDVSDRATEREEDLRADALTAQQQRAALGDPDRWQEISAKWCAGCGLRIPDARRKAIPGVQLCVDCKEDAELLGRQGRLMTRYGQRGED